MQVAFLVSNFPKNSETFVLNQITGLLDRGHEVDVFARYEPSEEQVHDVVDEYNLRKRTTYSDPPDDKLTRLLHSPVKAVRAPVGNLQAMLKSLKIYEYGRDALSLQAFYMASSFNLDGYDLIYCHFGPNGNVGALFERSSVNANLVTMFHGKDIRTAFDGRRDMYTPAFEESDLLLANSEFNREKLVRLGADPEKVGVHPIAIDTERFRCPDDRNSADSEPVVVTTVGRLVEEKGHAFAIDALPQVARRTNCDIEYRLIGSGYLENDLRQRTRQHDVAESVVFRGQLSRAGVIEELCQSDIFLLPSVDEGFGTVLLEAQSAKLPVVATRIGGIPEAVGDDASTLVKARDSEALADKLVALVQSPARRDAMGKAGRQFVVNNYTIEAANDLLESRFETLLNDGSVRVTTHDGSFPTSTEI